MVVPGSLDGANLTQGTARLAVIGEASSKFVFWVLRSPEAIHQWNAAIGGATFRALNLEPLARTIVPVPPLAEQQAIAAFLDRETAKLDALVEEQRRLIALLKEKRQAVISHAVTRGLDPTAPLKPSGIDWLGDIPAHWSAVQFRRFVKLSSRGGAPIAIVVLPRSENGGLLKAGCVNKRHLSRCRKQDVADGAEPRPNLEVKPGNLVMSRASGSPQLIGSMALIERTQEKLMLSDKLFRLRLGEHQEPRFVRWLFASTAVREQIILAISGAEGMANNLPQSKIREIRFLLLL